VLDVLYISIALYFSGFSPFFPTWDPFTYCFYFLFFLYSISNNDLYFAGFTTSRLFVLMSSLTMMVLSMLKHPYMLLFLSSLVIISSNRLSKVFLPSRLFSISCLKLMDCYYYFWYLNLFYFFLSIFSFYIYFEF